MKTPSQGTTSIAVNAPQTRTVGTQIAFNKIYKVISISNAFFDGDPIAVIPDGYVVDQVAERIRRDLATAWMDAEGLAQPGALYILDALPAHYKVACNSMNTPDRHVYVYGLPGSKCASSRHRFFQHFRYMKLHGTTYGCKCEYC